MKLNALLLPDEKYGEVVHAALVISSEVSEKEIQEFLFKLHKQVSKIPEKIHCR